MPLQLHACVTQRARWTYFLILVALVRGSRLLDAVAEEALAVGCDAVAHENHMSNAFGKKWDEVGWDIFVQDVGERIQ